MRRATVSLYKLRLRCTKTSISSPRKATLQNPARSNEMRITAAALILACSGLLFVVADAAGLRPPYRPWSETESAATLRPPSWPWSEDAETESFGCCSPVIVRTASEIRSVHGHGYVTINADYGPRYPSRNRCHPNDYTFTYVVI